MRVAAPNSLYYSLVTLTQSAYTALHANGSSTSVSISIQLETCWGVLGEITPYRGISTDMVDFSFAQFTGVSTYPYFSYPKPNDMPPDYWTRPAAETDGRPVYHAEGNWATNASTSTAIRWPWSEADQAKYVTRLASWLTMVNATEWMCLIYADLDWGPQYTTAQLAPFLSIGVANSNLTAKTALQPWDAVFSIPYTP